MSIKYTDNSLSVKKQLNNNILNALHAMGAAGVECIREQMRSGYGKPIHQTGALENSITYEIDAEAQQVIVGSPLECAEYVHEGTAKMPGRPFVRDGIQNNRQTLQDIAAQELSK